MITNSITSNETYKFFYMLNNKINVKKKIKKRAIINEIKM